jgi:F0F1-type ATP synthase assembly protein I
VEKIGDRPNRQKNHHPFLRRAGLYVAIAFELPATIFGGMLVGYLLDSYFATSPWLLIALTVVAFVTAIARVLRWVKLFAAPQNGNGIQKNHTVH